MESSSCWCCDQCIHLTLDRRPVAAADDDNGAIDANGDVIGDVEQQVSECNGLIEAHELCQAQQTLILADESTSDDGQLV